MMGETNQQRAGIMRGVLEIVTNLYPDTKIAILIFDPQTNSIWFSANAAREDIAGIMRAWADRLDAEGGNIATKQ